MNIEYEATFPDIDKKAVRKKLKEIGAKLIHKERLMKRVVFDLPKGHGIKGGWLRVRDEGDKITLSLKIVDGPKIENQKEVCLKIDDFKKAENLLSLIGCQNKSYQENKREVWFFDDCEIFIDEWPFLEPFVEIEGRSEKMVKTVVKKLCFDYKKALFCAVDTLYNKKYGIPFKKINRTPYATFKIKNPFI